MPKTISLSFGDDLCNPMPRRKRTGTLMSVSIVDDPAWKIEWRRRLELLFDHYGIDLQNDPDWQATHLVSLINDFVPGLTETKPERRGRRRTRLTPTAREARRHLLKAVEEKKLGNSSLSDLAACKYVAGDWRRNPPDHILAARAAGYLSRQLADARRERREDERITALAHALASGTETTGICLPIPRSRPRLSALLLGDVPQKSE